MTCFLAGMLTVTGVSAGQVDDVPPQTNGRGVPATWDTAWSTATRPTTTA